MMLLLVMIGAALGAPTRWALDNAVKERRSGDLPMGTLTINIVGSALLGLLLAYAQYGGGSAALVALAGTGFCGGFTTFSTFSYETAELLQRRERAMATLYVGLSLIVGFAAACVGWYTGAAIWQG